MSSSLSDSYRKAQAELGIDEVLREQFRVIGAKAWSEMTRNEQVMLINSLRRLWAKKNKHKVKK